MNIDQLSLTIIAVVLIAFITMVTLIASCDNRIATPSLTITSNTSQVYLNDTTIINITVKYTSDTPYNQRIYFKTDNGYIRSSETAEWCSADTVSYLNTNEAGEAHIKYKCPTSLGYANITCYADIYSGLVYIGQITNTLTMHVLGE